MITRVAGIATFLVALAGSVEAQGTATPVGSVVGAWTGTVELVDGSQSLEAEYRFVKKGEQLSGTATATGQGSGEMTEVSQNGVKVRWTVVLPQGTFVHDGTLTDNSHLEGVILLDNFPVASFKLVRAP